MGRQAIEWCITKVDRHIAEVLHNNGATSANDADFHWKSFKLSFGNGSIVGRSDHELLNDEEKNPSIEFSKIKMTKRMSSGAYGGLGIGKHIGWH